MGKKKFLKSRYYLINPYKKIIITKKFNSAPEGRRYKKPSKKLENTFIAIKGERVNNLTKKFRFKFKKQ